MPSRLRIHSLPLVLCSLLMLCATVGCRYESGIAGQPELPYDVAITDVDVFDSEHKTLHEHRTILINADTIAAVVAASVDVVARRTIEGNGRLVVPGFIDTHTHLNLTFERAKDTWPAALGPDSSAYYRAVLSEQYLNYGTTSIVDMGMAESYMSTSLDWQKHPAPGYPNIYVAGGAMISDQEREPYITHVEIENPEAGREKVRSYAELGVRHIKLYKFLREPELRAVVEEAQNQDLIMFGHIDDNVVTIQQAMDLGVVHFEHLLSLPASLFTYRDHYQALSANYGVRGIGTLDEYAAAIIFFFQYIKDTPEFEEQLLQLFERMARQDATLSTTIHVLGATAGKTYFFSSFDHYPDRDAPLLPGYSEEMKQELARAFDTMMQFLKTAHEAGVKIRIGTDCKYGGRALLSELMVLYEAGFSVEDILQIATWNGYEAMGLLDDYGTVAQGKKADLVMFEKNPFEDYSHFLSDKTVIKDGQVVER